MLVEQWWVKDPLGRTEDPMEDGGLPESEVMIPVEIEHTGANYSVRIQPTLHVGFNLVDNIGTGTPTTSLAAMVVFTRQQPPLNGPSL